MDSIRELAMNVDSIFIWIFSYIHVPMDIQKLNLNIFGVIPDPDSGPYRETEFSGNFHRG